MVKELVRGNLEVELLLAEESSSQLYQIGNQPLTEGISTADALDSSWLRHPDSIDQRGRFGSPPRLLARLVLTPGLGQHKSSCR